MPIENSTICQGAPRKAAVTGTTAPRPSCHQRPAIAINSSAAVPVTREMGTPSGAVMKYASNSSANSGKAARNTSRSLIAERGGSSSDSE